MGIAPTLIPISVEAQTGVLSHMSVASTYNRYNGQLYASVWGYWAGGREYALATVQNTGGTSIVDITDPRNPVERAFVSSPNGLWHELKTYRNYMYKCADQGTAGVQIVNLAGLPNSVQELTAYRGPGINRCHNLWVDSTTTPARLYVQVGTGPSAPFSGILIASLANPAVPVELGRVLVETHDMWAVQAIKPNRLYVSTGYTRTWDAYNITNPAAPVRISRTTFATTAPPGEPTTTYSHNIWVSDDGRYAFTTQETAGSTVKAWDLTNETAPTLAATYIANVNGNTNIIAHNVLVFRRFLYVPHYTAGLRVVDISARPLPSVMPEVGYHRPSTATGIFDGTWGSYQYFPSGVLLHGDNVQGLMILIPDATIIQPNVPTALDPVMRQKNGFDIAGGGGHSVRFHLPSAGGYVLSIFNPAGESLIRHRGRGEGLQTLSLGKNLASGKYAVRLEQETGAYNATVSMGR